MHACVCVFVKEPQNLHTCAHPLSRTHTQESLHRQAAGASAQASFNLNTDGLYSGSRDENGGQGGWGSRGSGGASWNEGKRGVGEEGLRSMPLQMSTMTSQSVRLCLCGRVCVHASVCVHWHRTCVRTCVRACVRACMCACVRAASPHQCVF